MYNNIGGKIKGYATFVCVIGIFFAIGVFILLWSLIGKENGGGIGFLCGLLGGGILFLTIWISTWLLYGFGTMVENSDEQVKLLLKQNKILCEALGIKEPKIKSYDLYIDKNEDDNTDGAPYHCQVCDHPGPFGRFCPKCGSTLKVYPGYENSFAGKVGATAEERAPDEYEAEPDATVMSEEKAKRLFCNHCGSRLEEKDTYCPGCGEKVE